MSVLSALEILFNWFYIVNWPKLKRIFNAERTDKNNFRWFWKVQKEILMRFGEILHAFGLALAFNSAKIILFYAPLVLIVDIEKLDAQSRTNNEYHEHDDKVQNVPSCPYERQLHRSPHWVQLKNLSRINELRWK